VKNVVRDLRGQHGLTQEDLAQRVGVSRQTIISIESGRYNPSIMLAHKIAQVFAQPIELVFLCQDELEEENKHD